MVKTTFLLSGNRLTQIKKKKKSSHAQVSKLLEINQDAYGRYKRKKVKFSVDIVVKIANALSV